MDDTRHIPDAPSPSRPAPGSLSRHLTLAWVILTLYGSLYPFSGWQDNGIHAFAFLEWAWPRYWTVFDLIANVVVYLPAGFLATLALSRLPGRFTAPVLAVLFFALLSLAMEALQTWLPSRISSNLDFACNTFGALLGSLAACYTGERLRARWRYCRQHFIAALPHVDLGLTLLGLWLLTLLSPETLLFGVGDLRQAFPGLPTLSYGQKTYLFMEKAVVVSHFLAIGLFSGAMTRGRWFAYLFTPLFFCLAALIRSLGAAALAGAGAFFAWFTPGVREGLILAVPMLAFALLLPPLGRLMLAALCLLTGAVLVNLAPIDPYSLDALVLWRQGHFLNFNGLIRWISTIWPFLALPYLILVGKSRATRGP